MRLGRADVRSCPIPASRPKSSNTCDFIASRSRLPFSGYTLTPRVAQIRAFKASSTTYPQRYAQPSYKPESNSTSASCRRSRASSCNCSLVDMARTKQKIHHRVRPGQIIIIAVVFIRRCRFGRAGVCRSNRCRRFSTRCRNRWRRWRLRDGRCPFAWCRQRAGAFPRRSWAR